VAPTTCKDDIYHQVGRTILRQSINQSMTYLVARGARQRRSPPKPAVAGSQPTGQKADEQGPEQVAVTAHVSAV
jgi:hypothetical protein